MIHKTLRDQFRFKWWALLGICVLAFTAFLDVTIVNTALPFIQTALNADILQLQWIANIFAIILSMTMIAIGKFADLWGRKRVFYFGVFLFAFAALGAGYSTTVPMLVISRGLQALGASTIIIASATLLTDVFPERERVKAISIYGGITGFGLMIGPFLGGILISLLDWRWVFWINLPLIVLGLAACSFSLKRESKQQHRVQIDWWGLFLLVFGLGILMYGIIDGAQEHWSSTRAWACLIVGAISLVFLIILDTFRKHSLLDLHIFKNKLIVLGALSSALAGVVSTVFMFFDPLYLRVLRDLSPFLIGILIAIIPAAQALISFVFNRSVRWLGVTNLLFISIISAFIAVILHRWIGESTPLLFLVLPFFLLGVNWGLSNAAMITAANLVIPPHQIGSALGTIWTIWNFVGAVLLATSTAVFHAVEINSSFLPAFHSTIEFNILFAGIVFLAALWVRLKIKKKPKPTS